MPNVKCPNASELADFDSGQLPETQAELIGTHIDACANCRTAIEATGSRRDSVAAALQRRPPENFDHAEPGFQLLQNFVARIEQDPKTVLLPNANKDSAVSLAGKRIGAYHVIEKIGEGGMGAVYKARHERLEKIVAIKVLPDERMKDPQTVARFNREMKAIGQMAHTNIVAATDAGFQDGWHFLVMEYVDGEDLSQLLRRLGPFPVADAVAAVVQAGDALQHAHALGIVHRDIKPANLMLACNGTIKLLDLGLAQLDERHASVEHGLTMSSQVMGTLEYMAPEQGLESRKVDARADIYSLGATLYKLLCGEAPFPVSRYDTPMKMMRALSTEEPPSIAGKCSLPAELVNVIDHMLKREPDERFRTVQEVMEKLRPFAREASLAGLYARTTNASSKPSINPGDSGTTDQIRAASAETEPSHDLVTPSRDLATAKLPHQHSPSRLSRWLVVATATIMLSVIAMAAVVLLLPSKHGTVRIEINDPSIGVVVSGDGHHQIKGKDAEFKIEPGPHTLKVTAGDITFQTREFSITKGKRISLRVSLIEGETIRVLQGNKVLHEEPIPGTASVATSDEAFQWPPNLPRPAIAPLTEDQAKEIQAEWAKHLNVPVEREVKIADDIVLTLVLIPPGEFQMGASPAEQDQFRKVAKRFQDTPALDKIPTEGPRHVVRITKPFYLGKHEVTQAQWKAVMGTSPSKSSGLQKPVENVSWVQIRRFIFKLTSDVEEQTPFLLPTEAQWEYVCRAGTTTPWSWGEDETDFDDFAWCSENSGGSPQPVGKLKPNAWGLYDMHGNVWEMCADRFGPDYYYDSPKNDPTGPTETFTYRAGRGGSWNQLVARTRSAHRDRCVPSLTHENVGFRVALDVLATTKSGD